jgi:hypothetical protein
MASARNGHEVARFVAHFGRQGDLPRHRRPARAVGSKKTDNREGIMERDVKPRSTNEGRRAGGKAGVEHRFGEIGISAVVAAVRYHGDRQDEQPAQSDFALSFDRD